MTEYFETTESIFNLDDSNKLSLNVHRDSEEGSVFFALSVDIPRKRGRATHTTVNGYGTTPEQARDTLRFVLTREYNWTGNDEETTDTE